VLHELERAGVSVFERGWLSSNNILLHGDDNHAGVVVDTGYWIHAEQTVGLLRQALRGRPLARIVNTHLHSDHCGGNAAIQAAFGCTIDVPAGESAVVDAWAEDALTYKATGQHCPRFTRQGSIHVPSLVGAGRWQWEAIASPGHDPRSFALYQPELEVLISADALWENGFGVVFPELEGGSAFADVRRTLDAFSRLRVRHVIPGHGAPFGDMPAAIGRALHRLEGFEKDPRKHALHAVKVLIKFRLLETQKESWSSLRAWLSRASYFEKVRRHHFSDTDPSGWIESLLTDMANRGAVILEGDSIRNA